MKELIFNTHDIVLLATIYQSILFALLIRVVKHDRHPSDYFLIGFLLTQSAIPFHILINYGEEFRFIALNFLPDSYRIFEIAYWLEGPLLLWYTRSLVYKHFRLTWVDATFLVPALVYLIYMGVTFYSLESAVKYDILVDYQTEKASLSRHASGFIREALRVMFSVLCLIDIRHCRQQIRARYSNVEKIDFGWLNFLVIGFLIIRVWAILVSLAIILNVHGGWRIDFGLLGLIGNYTTFLLVSALIFFSLSRSSLFEGLDDSNVSSNDALAIDPELVAKIEQHMEERKPYLANILTLDQLATQLEMSPRMLSTIINRHFEQNFFEFVNRYRVEEAKRQLSNPELKRKTMIEVMGDCGFNSKATFNTIFKKLVGSTPSQFRARSLV